MATSTNYGWAEPDNSSLVKNGASDIRTLGNAIDASLWNVGYGQAGKNKVINGDFGIWQRGTTISFAASGNPYGADRWNVFSGNTGTSTRQATGDTTNLPFIQYAARIQRTAGITSVLAFEFGQAIETSNSIPFVGKTVTLSFYIRKGANFSGSTLNAQLISGTGTDQNPITGSYTGQATPISSNIASSLTTTWQRITLTGTVATSATELTIRFYWVPSGTAGAADYYEVTGVQLEAGSTATPFQTASGSIGGELALCQRYYVRFGGNSADEIIGTIGTAYATTAAAIAVPLPVTMRTKPASVEYSTIGINDIANSIIAVTSLTLSGTASPSVGAVTASVASGATQYRPYRLQTNNSTSGYVGFSAEL
jgi:hypothetical protein